MRKVQAGISIDIQVWEEVKRIYAGKISGKVEDYLIRLINYHKSNIDGLKIQEIELKLHKETAKLNESMAKIEEYKEQMGIIRLEQDKKEAEMLEKEKQEMLKMVTCIHCGIPKHQERMHKTNDNDMLCNGCYLSLDNNTLRPYFNAKKVKDD